MNSVEKISVIQ